MPIIGIVLLCLLGLLILLLLIACVHAVLIGRKPAPSAAPAEAQMAERTTPARFPA